MNQKPFDTWNKEKKTVDQAKSIKFFREGEVWWVKLGINVGIEQNGKGDDFSRPVLVLRKYRV